MYSNFQMDQTLFLQFVNVARTIREGMRPFRRLTKLDTTNSVGPGNSWNTRLILPSDFEYLTEDGIITLFDGNQTFQDITEVGIDRTPEFNQTSNVFAIDHANLVWYIFGVISQAYKAYIYYQADYGDITLTTSWTNIPSRYHMMLAFDALNMYEMGVDYDDLQARNATKLGQMAETLYNAMCQWDDRLQRSATAKRDYGVGNGETFTPNMISDFRR